MEKSVEKLPKKINKSIPKKDTKEKKTQDNSAIKSVKKVDSKKIIVKDTKKTISKTKKQKEEYSGPVYRNIINDREIILLGTAHVSKESVDDVVALIQKEKPKSVAVELCETRFKAIQDKERWKNLDIVQVIKEKKIFLLMSTLILSAFQKRMGDLTHVKPGEEMLVAIETAKQKKISISLIDRDAQITLKRAWQKAGFFGRTALMSELVGTLFVSHKPTSEEIESLKQGDMIDQVFQNLPYRYNIIKKVIIDERDQYLAQKIKNDIINLPKKAKMIAVVGAGHVEGIKKYLNQNESINLLELEEIKKPSKLFSVLQFFAPIVLITVFFFYYGGFHMQEISHNILTWCIIKSLFSGIAALFFLPHPLTVISAALVAPISNFNPILKPGWVAALVEAKFHKPKVSDFESFANDTENFAGIYKNKVSRIFGLLLLPQLASSLATAVALWYIAK